MPRIGLVRNKWTAISGKIANGGCQRFYHVSQKAEGKKCQEMQRKSLSSTRITFPPFGISRALRGRATSFVRIQQELHQMGTMRWFKEKKNIGDPLVDAMN